MSNNASLTASHLLCLPVFLFFLFYTIHYLPMGHVESHVRVRRWCCQDKKKKSLPSFHLMLLIVETLLLKTAKKRKWWREAWRWGWAQSPDKTGKCQLQDKERSKKFLVLGETNLHMVGWDKPQGSRSELREFFTVNSRPSCEGWSRDWLVWCLGLGLAVAGKKKERPLIELKWGGLSLGPTFGEIKKKPKRSWALL